MGAEPGDLKKGVTQAVRHFWRTRQRQAKTQGAISGRADRGGRRAVTAGRHMEGFAKLLKKLVVAAGACKKGVHWRTRVELPGYYRAEKQWDFLVVQNGKLLAVAELKSHVGPSFGNNYNNRAEEALGSAADYWAAFREGAFACSPRPWLGYLLLLEEAPASKKPVSVRETHFPVFEEFRNASYVTRYELLLTRMVREGLYDAACLILSAREKGKRGDFLEPCEELSFASFAQSLLARIMAHLKVRG